MPRVKEQPNADGYYKRTVTAKDGKRIYGRSKKSNADALRDANAKRLEYEESGMLLKDQTTFEACAKSWLELEVVSSVSEKEYYTLTKRLEKFVYPQIGNKPLFSISPTDVQAVLNSDEIKSKSMITKIKQYMSRVFEFACRQGLLKFNPADMVKAPKRKEGSRRPLTDLERAAFLKAAETHRAGLWVLTMLYCGLRRGETVPLTWGDIDIKAGTITVNKAVSYHKNEIILKEPKTKAGTRTISIPLPLLERLKATKKHTPTDLMFPSASGKIMSYTAVRKLWSSFILAANKAAGAETLRGAVPFPVLDQAIGPHYLRHTCAADLYRMGADLKTAQIYLGHANIQTTANIYMSFEGHNDITKLQQAYYCGKNVATKTYKIKRRVAAQRKASL